MQEEKSFLSNSKTEKTVFLISLFVALYWILGQTINIYLIAFVGAVYEILWLPLIILLFGLPVLSFVFWVKEKFFVRSLFLYSFIIGIGSILFLMLS